MTDKRPNENQARRLRVTCQHIDRVLCEIERAMDEASSATAFPTYIQDISPDQRRVIGGALPDIRERLVDILIRQGIAHGGPQIPVSRAIRGWLYSIDLALDEIRPGPMQGFGSVSTDASAELQHIADDLQQVIRHIDKDLDDDTGMNR